MTQLQPWTHHVHLQADVARGDSTIATYAIDLGALVSQDGNVPLVYRDPQQFFRATYLTSGLRDLLTEVLGRLAGQTGDRVLQLHSPFGGGKSHTLTALYHAARHREALRQLPEALHLPDPGVVRTAVFDGEKFDVQGRPMNGQHTLTMWGLLAAQLGCYEVVAYHDQNRIAPGGDKVAEMLGQQPTLILLDEVLKYLVRSQGEVMRETVGETTLGALTQDFLQTLSTEVARTSTAVLVYSLQASDREAFGHQALLDSLDHLVSRVDAKREPVTGDEILPVLQRRLLAEKPPAQVAQAVAAEFARQITRMQMAHALDEETRQDAEAEQLTLQERLTLAYPFHPALVDVMRERWASLPDFQRTRGALRFLSLCLHVLSRDRNASYLLGPGDIPIEDGAVARAFFTEVGQRDRFQAVMQSDFVGPNARIKRIDEQLANENAELGHIRPAMRLATTILAYSFGGLLRADEAGGEPIGSGVSEAELLAAVVRPGLDSITAQTALRQLRDRSLYLHYDGAKYVFKTTPNITHLIEQARVGRDDVEQAIEQELRSRLSGRAGAIVWPAQSQQIPHKEPQFLLAYLSLDFAFLTPTTQEQRAKEWLTQYGELPRSYRNGLGLVIPDRRNVERLRQAQRNLLAIEKVKARRVQHNLTTPQLQQLEERKRDEESAFQSAIRNLYPSVWLPVMAHGEFTLDKVSVAGRPLPQTTLHEQLMALLTDVPPYRVFKTLLPAKMVELLRLGETRQGVPISSIVDAFFETPGFPRLRNDGVLRQTIMEGVHEGLFGYVPGGRIDEDRIREGGRYLIKANDARIRESLAPQDVDMTSGFVVLPGAIEQTETPIETDTAERMPPLSTTETGGTTVPYHVTVDQSEPDVAQPERQTAVRLRLRMTRQQLYASTNALSNLAQEAGVIEVIVTASKISGFDPNWLRNAVLEPLDEADVDVEEL